MASNRPPTGEEIVAQVRRETGGKTILAFSTGKDSIAAMLAIRDAFDEVIPVYMYLVPGLEFVEESLAYSERVLFGGRRIRRMPHPSLYRWLNGMVYQPPHRAPVIKAARLRTGQEAVVMGAGEGGSAPARSGPAGYSGQDHRDGGVLIGKAPPYPISAFTLAVKSSPRFSKFGY